MEARRVEARKEEALVALETALTARSVTELRTNTEAAWHSEQDAERLQAKVVLVCEEVLARAQRILQQARATRDQDELRKVGLEAVSTADKDTLCVIAVKAAAHEGVDMNTRAEAVAGEEPKSWLRLAAEGGFVETVRALLAAGAEVDHVDTEGETALDGAACHGKVDAMRALLAAGAEVDHVDNLGSTALDGAANNGEVGAIRALLAAGAEVDHANIHGWTALNGAAINGEVEAIRALLQAGADINRADNNGGTPLAIARAKNHEAAVLALVQAGATE